MKIAIDLTPLHGRKWTGVELYAIDLYHTLLELNYNVVPIFHVENDLDNNSSAFMIGKTKRLWLENYSLSKALRTIKADVALFPIFPPPIDIYINRPSKIVPVIHDTAFIRYRSTLKFAAKYYLTPKYKIALKASDYLVTISETSKKQLSDYSKLRILNWGENISVDFKKENLRISDKHLNQFNLLPNQYYISVSTIDPRKNLKYLLDIIQDELIQNQKKLVLVGRKGWGNDIELQKKIEKLQEYIVFTDYVTLEELQSLYHYAYAFTLMSLDEGFGRTPLEAIACGCKRIIVSDIDVFHETMGNYVNYLPLNNTNFCKHQFLQKQWKITDKDFPIPFNDMIKKIFLIDNSQNKS